MKSTAIDISGLDKLLSQLTKISDRSDDIVSDTINDVLDDTQLLARDGINNGSPSGTVYYRIPGEKYMTIRAGSADGPPVAFVPGGGPQNLSPVHKASAPGQYPATDTGTLSRSIIVERSVPGPRMEGTVGTRLEYGSWLEFGTTKMAKRPWLLNSFKTAIMNVTKELKARLDSLK